MVAVVSEHEVAVFGNFVWTEVSSCFLRDEAFVQWDFGVVDVNFSVCDLDFFSGESDEALDEEFFSSSGYLKMMMSNRSGSFIFFDISCPKRSILIPYASRKPKRRSPVITVFSIDSEGILALISTTLFMSVTISTTMMIIFA